MAQGLPVSSWERAPGNGARVVDPGPHGAWESWPVTTWTARELAAAAGISANSARGLVRDLGLACVGRDQDTGAKLYDRAQARAALAARPGRGRRTDLGKLGRPFTADELAEVRRWQHCGERATEHADRLGEGRAATALTATAEQMRRLVEAARTYPLHAMHPGWGSPHRRLYDLAAEMGRQMVPLARNAHLLGERTPLLWDEMDALLTRLVELVDLAATGQPMPCYGHERA